jgi:AAA domain
VTKEKDINDILREDGEEAVRAHHASAEPFDESNPKFQNGNANGSNARTSFNSDAKAARKFKKWSPSITPDPSADEHTGHDPNAPGNDDEPPPLLIKTSKQFVADFVPPDYIVDGLLQEGFLYSLTGATGAGKTAITLRLAASTALGVVFAGRETKRRRVLYLAAENPDDVRMRWIALSQQMHFDIDAIEVFFVEGVFKISQAKDRLREEAEKLGGDFGLVIIDTSPVFYEGEDESSRTQQGNHAVMLRELISVIPGKPAVIANCHPVKNATADNLLPAGGGNFLNQVDGNLTAAKTDSTTELHTQGKFRGVEFAPMHFLIKTVTHQDVKDSKGRPIPTVICEWVNDKEKENIAAQAVSDEDAVLKIISDDPKATQPSIARKMDWKLFSGEPNKMRAGRCIKALVRDGLIKETRRGNYVVTPEGRGALNQK